MAASASSAGFAVDDVVTSALAGVCLHGTMGLGVTLVGLVGVRQSSLLRQLDREVVFRCVFRVSSCNSRASGSLKYGGGLRFSFGGSTIKWSGTACEPSTLVNRN